MGERLRLIMEDKGLKQSAFAYSVEISQGYLSDIMAGKKEPRGTVLVAISGKYGYNLEWLKTGEGEMGGPGQKALREEDEVRYSAESYQSIDKKEAEERAMRDIERSLKFIQEYGSLKDQKAAAYELWSIAESIRERDDEIGEQSSK